GVIAGYEMVDFRRTMLRDTTVLADAIAKNSQAALAFQDEAAAEKIMSALQAEPAISGACLYNAEGALFAKFVRKGWSMQFPASPSPAGYRYEGGKLSLFRPVILNDKQVGTLYMQADLQGVYDRAW